MRPAELQLLCERELGMQKMHLGPNGWWRSTCPLHSELNPSFGIFSGADYHPYLCFICGKGSLLSLVMRVRSLTQKDALRLIKQYGEYGQLDHASLNELPEFDKRFQCRFQVMEFDGIKGEPLLAPYEGKKLAAISKHLGVCKTHLQKCRIGYDAKNKRIVYPWFYQKQLVGMTGRTIETRKGVPKMMPYYGFNKSYSLYLPFGKINPNKPLVLFEAEKASMMAARVYSNVCATGFAHITKEQGRIISDHVSTVIAFPDPDEGGDRFMRTIVERLLDRVQLYYAPPIGERHPDEHDERLMRKALKINRLRLVLTPNDVL